MKVVYTSYSGRYSDSPRAIYEALAVRRPEFDHTWLCHPDHAAAFPPDVRTVPFGSPAGVAAMEAADVLVSNDHVPLDWDKRPGSTYLQTWHGTPLKRIHHDVRWAPEGRLEQLDVDIARWDHLLSPNRASTPRLRRAFGFTGEIHETGYPRNDLLSSPDRFAAGAAVRAQLGIPADRTVVLYTPTWRDDLVFGTGGPGYTMHLDLDDFTARLGADHVLLLRLHSLVPGRLTLPPGAPVIDVSGYRDVRDLYLAADLLVTDYSSTMFDFAVTGRPILLFAYDLDRYRDQVRGFYFDLAAAAPGPVLPTSAELVTAIRHIGDVAQAYEDRYSTFRRTFCHLEDGHATDRVLSRFFLPDDQHPVPHQAPPEGDRHAHR
jgi:CDP-glycerol glycerophosphotransferase